MDRGRRDPVPAELLGEPVRAVLRPGEDERLLDPAAPDQVAQEVALALPIDRQDELRDQLRGRVPRRDLDGRRIVEEAKEIRARAIVMPLPPRRTGASIFGRTLETVLTERPARVIIDSSRVDGSPTSSDAARADGSPRVRA